MSGSAGEDAELLRVTSDELRAAGSVHAEEEAALLLSSEGSDADRAARIRRRIAGEPLEQVLGWAAFRGLRIAVAPDVFVPRRRSELMVREALRGLAPRATVVDLCCGTGAIGAAIRDQQPRISLHAADLSPAAIECARSNLGDGVAVYVGDLYDALPARLRGRIDLLVANVPYVPSDEVALLPPEARLHEPLVALDGGTDGLDLVRRVAVGASDWLAPRGRVLVETSEAQADAARNAFSTAGLDARVVSDGDLDATVVVGTFTPAVG